MYYILSIIINFETKRHHSTARADSSSAGSSITHITFPLTFNVTINTIRLTQQHFVHKAQSIKSQTVVRSNKKHSFTLSTHSILLIDYIYSLISLTTFGIRNTHRIHRNTHDHTHIDHNLKHAYISWSGIIIIYNSRDQPAQCEGRWKHTHTHRQV